MDPRVTWEFTWKAFKKLFLIEKRRRKEAVVEVIEEIWEIQQLRGKLAQQHDPTFIKRSTTLEAIVRGKDRKDALAWRRRSRVRWLAIGDAPSKYVFA